MTDTGQLTKTSITYYGIEPGDILDGEEVTGTTFRLIDGVPHVGLKFGELHGELVIASQPVSVYR